MEEGHDGGVGARENVPGDDARRLLDTQGSTDLRIPRSSQLEAALGCRVMSSAQYRSEPLSFVRSMCAARQDRLCVTPMTRVIAPSHFRPRQFEYHPRKAEELVLGSVSGDVIVLNHPTGSVVGSTAIRGPAHSILGLCWLHTDGSLLISGADNGNIQLLDVDLMKKGEGEAALYEYDPFEHLTSVHINSLDDSFLVSGYSNDVGLYDLKIGKKIQTFKDLHTQHINVLKFANHSPSLFATSSFDGDVKMWDLRQGMQVLAASAPPPNLLP
jgi:WD40 repeat protein